MMFFKSPPILVLATAIFLAGCNSSQTARPASSQLPYDTSVIVVLPYDMGLSWICEHCQPAELTAEDFENIEAILQQCLDEYNPAQEKQFLEMSKAHPDYIPDKNDFIIDLKRYKRQYIATLNARREKEIWVNCFCGGWSQGARTGLLLVLDGGNCYFNVRINLTTGKYDRFEVNGEA